MNTKEHEDTIKELIANYCLLSTQLNFVESVSQWCRDNGIEEPDKNKPLRFILLDDKTCQFVINDLLPDKLVKERLNALRVRGALVNVADNPADRLDSDKKKLAYLIMAEYSSMAQVSDDELIADKWVLDQMERLGYFRE